MLLLAVSRKLHKLGPTVLDLSLRNGGVRGRFVLAGCRCKAAESSLAPELRLPERLHSDPFAVLSSSGPGRRQSTAQAAQTPDSRDSSSSQRHRRVRAVETRRQLSALVLCELPLRPAEQQSGGLRVVSVFLPTRENPKQERLAGHDSRTGQAGVSSLAPS